MTESGSNAAGALPLPVDQLDVAIEMEVRLIRKQVNQARQRLGLPITKYNQERKK